MPQTGDGFANLDAAEHPEEVTQLISRQLTQSQDFAV